MFLTTFWNNIILEKYFFLEYQHFTVFCCNFLKFREIFIKIQSKNDEICLKISKICENLQKFAQKKFGDFLQNF